MLRVAVGPRIVLTLALAAALASSARGAAVWREGESADQAQMQNHSWYNSVQKDMLSGGDWLSNFGDEAGFAAYRLEIPEPGRYTLWVRANPHKSRLSWRWGEGEWRQAPTSKVRHRRNVAQGGALDVRFIGWIRLGEVELDQGPRSFQFKIHSDNKNHGAIDAIYLTTDGRRPVGKGDPAEAAQKHAAGYFPWSPETDPLNGESPIDLRYLNEAAAGAGGFVRAEGDHFVRGDGETIRFWTVQGGLGDDPQQYDRRARRLAKYGVNLVRMGGGAFFNEWRRDKQAFRRRLDRFHRKVAALKKQGVYTYIDHLYWHTHTPVFEEDFPRFGDGRSAIALIFFSEKFQGTYQEFLRDLMTAKNPHTGKSMADDPAVAFVEIQNESGLLFHTFKPREFPESELRLVERKFGQWLEAKYGSLAGARRAWGEDPRSGGPTPDHFDEGRAGLYSAGMLTGARWAQNQRNQQRASDQLQFLVESQKVFYEMMTRRMHDDLGLKQVIVASNWKSADARVLDALERYTYTGAEVICRNSYFGVDYKEGGRQRFNEIEVGDTYRYHSALRSPARPGPLGTPQIAGYPFMVTENNWTRPNRYRVEWPLLAAAYGRMLGVDGWTFFAKSDVDWRHRMGVWDVSNPSVLGQFPAAALIYRRGDVREPAEPAVREQIGFDDAYQMKGAAAAPLRGADALWEDRLGEAETAAGARSRVSPLAYFVGPVVQKFVSGPSSVASVDLDAYIDRDQRTVCSMTGELSWDTQAGVMTVNTPRAQGAWGFLGEAGAIELGDITLRLRNSYGAVVAVSLDGKPIRQSNRVLIQTGTWDRPYGFETEAAGPYRRITNLGGYPLNVRRIEGSVQFHREVNEAVVLNGNGYPTARRAEASRSGGRTRLTLPADSLYTLVR